MENSTTVRTNHEETDTHETGVEEGIIMEEITQHKTVKKELPPTISSDDIDHSGKTSKLSAANSCFPGPRSFSTTRMQDLFDGLDPSEEWDIALMENYSAKDNRIGTFIDYKESRGNEWYRGIVDFRRHPTFQQVLDLVYDRGAECEIRIILFDDLSPTGNPSEDLDVVVNLVKLLNKYGVNVFLVQAEKGHPFSPDSVIFTEIHGPSRFIPRQVTSAGLPEKRKLQEVEFWVCYYDAESGITNSVIYQPEMWLDYGSCYCLMDCIVSIEWTDAGIFMTAEPEFDGGKNTLNWLRAEGMERLQKEYEGCEIKFYQKKGVPTQLTVKIDGKPIKSIFSATAHEKMEYAGLIRGEELRFLEFFQELGTEIHNFRDRNQEGEDICAEMNASA